MPVVHPTLFYRLRRLTRERRWLLLGAVSRLAVISLKLKVLPFRQAIRLGSGPIDGSRQPVASLHECVWAVRAAARGVPWRAVCIHQGLCLQQLLREKGYDARLHYGAAPGERPTKPLEAHVWVTVGDEVVIGGEEAERFATLATFP